MRNRFQIKGGTSMDKDKGDNNCDSSEDEAVGTWMHAKRTRVEKGQQSTVIKHPTISSPFASSPGRAVAGTSRTQRPSAPSGKSGKNPWADYLRNSSSRPKGRPGDGVQPYDKRSSHVENWMKLQIPLLEPRQPPANPANKRAHTTTPVPSTSHAELRARNINTHIEKLEKLIAARSRNRYKHLADNDPTQCKTLDKKLDSRNDLLSEWAWGYGKLLHYNDTRRGARTGSPVAGRSGARGEIDASAQPLCTVRLHGDRMVACLTRDPKKSQPGSSTSSQVAPERSSRMSDTPLTTDQVELLVHPLASDADAVLDAHTRDNSAGPDDGACLVSFAEDGPGTRASDEYINGGFISHLVGALSRIAPDRSPELVYPSEPPNVPSPPTENEIILNTPMDGTPDSGDARPLDATADSLQLVEDASHEEIADEPGQAPVQVSGSQDSLADAPAELDAKNASKENVNEGLNKAILSLLECPVCMEVMAPPLAQCRRGHLLCQGCRKRITSCPTCRSRFTASRNLAMEKVAEKLLYPCRHAGCAAVVPFKQRGQHEASCGRRAYTCSMPRCKERTLLQYDQLLMHHQTHHADILLWGSVTNFEIDIVNESMQDDWLVRAHTELFHVHFCVDTDNWGINSSVTYIGPKKNAHNYVYKMSVEDNSQYSRKFSYQRSTHSDTENRLMNYTKRDAFFIPLDGALFLARKKKSDHNKIGNYLCVTLNIKCRSRGEANAREVEEDVANGNVE